MSSCGQGRATLRTSWIGLSHACIETDRRAAPCRHSDQPALCAGALSRRGGNRKCAVRSVDSLTESHQIIPVQRVDARAAAGLLKQGIATRSPRLA